VQLHPQRTTLTRELLLLDSVPRRARQDGACIFDESESGDRNSPLLFGKLFKTRRNDYRLAARFR